MPKAAKMVILLVGLSFSAILAHSQNPSGCVSYEPSVVKLTGTVVRKTSTDAQTKPEKYWALELSRSICVDQDLQQPNLNYAQKDVRLVQLVFLDEKMFERVKGLLGKKVIAKGTLFAGISAHHHTSALLTVSTLEVGN
jgi:hypothetical protein